MTHPALTAFDATYDRLVMGRDFVEYRDYYTQSRARYRQTLQVIAGLELPAGSRHLDIGGGQMALLAAGLFGFRPLVGDVVPTAVADVVAQGADFVRLNLMEDGAEIGEPVDLVTMLEVIEHLPVPPYVVLQRLLPLLKPGGWLVMTTPNGFRIRNILRMLANREVLDIYRYPDGDEALGHQHEYTLRQMEWQLSRAGFRVHQLAHYRSGWRGASRGARLAHLLTLPATVFPHLRDGLMIAAQAPDG